MTMCTAELVTERSLMDGKILVYDFCKLVYNISSLGVKRDLRTNPQLNASCARVDDPGVRMDDGTFAQLNGSNSLSKVHRGGKFDDARCRYDCPPGPAPVLNVNN